MELSVRERQKALTVTLAMLCIACACLFYLFLAIKADELFAFFFKLVDSKCHGTYFGIERISFN